MKNKDWQDELFDLYSNGVLTESKGGDTTGKSGKVKSDVKVGKSFDGAEKEEPQTGTKSPAMKDVKKSKEKKTKLKESARMKNESFDDLYDKILSEDVFDQDESAVERSDAGEFNDDMEDFPPEGEDDGVGDEVDVATELKMVIDTLSDIAERMGAFDGEEEGEEEGDGFGGEEGGEGFEPELEESVQVKLQKLKSSVSKLQGKNNKVASKFKATGGKAKNVGPGKGKCDGKIENPGKSKFSPTMSGKANGNSPANKANADLF